MCRNNYLHISRISFLFLAVIATATAMAQNVGRHWTATDGLPTGEVHQIVELPNGQMLVNCEGVFCLSDGKGFQTIPCDYTRAYRLPHFSSGYRQLWQGDSLLWLRDFYRIYLFDARTRSFRYDITKENIDELADFEISTVVLTDRQGGLWEGSMQNGIQYTPPARHQTILIEGDNPTIALARSTLDSQGRIWHCWKDGVVCENGSEWTRYHSGNVTSLPFDRTTFVTELSRDRYLLCDSFCILGYFYPQRMEFVCLNDRLPALNSYRHFVGACPVDAKWVAVYSQNGAILLDTEADTLAPFPCAGEIERFSTKYNCIVRDTKGCLWVGTQNGLFKTHPQPLPWREGSGNRAALR